MPMNKQTQPREVVLPHHSYQPSRAELREDHCVDATFEEVVAACIKPVKVRYAKTPKRKR